MDVSDGGGVRELDDSVSILPKKKVFLGKDKPRRCSIIKIMNAFLVQLQSQ